MNRYGRLGAKGVNDRRDERDNTETRVLSRSRQTKTSEGGTMNAIALNGSARGKKGVTWRLLDSLLKGLSEGGATVRDIQLNELNISYCRACLTCMHKTPGQCAQRDDMDQLYPFLRESDSFVMGTPVYTVTI